MLKNSSALSDYDLIEMLLYYVFIRKDTKLLAKEILAKRKNIRNIIFSEKNDFKNIKGFGFECLTLFILLREFFIRANLNEISESTIIASSSQVMEYYKNIFLNIKYEQLRIMFLNGRNKLITEEIIQEGSINQTAIYPRTIIQRALEVGAAAIIIVHNHPSGDPQPSRQDIIMTKTLKDIAQKVEIILLDHLIIGINDVFSMKEHSII
ncbi:MAG: DNA repair protein RadC [Alphaproteobacteria bacterium]|nr:DNA repair protein RadC [Alphaproteobacteria bacterium]